MTDPRQWPPGRMLFAVLGALLLAAIVFQGLGSLAAPEIGSTKKKNAEPSGTQEPIRPTLERVDDWTIEIKEGSWHRSTFRFNETDGIETADEVYACLEKGIASEFDDNPTTSHKEMRSRMKALRKNCSPGVLRVLPPLVEPD